jgi:ABC-2 type transport system permease protein
VTRSLARTLAFFSKWFAEVYRQPALMVSLVIGPFLVLLAFGQGVDLGGPRPKTLVVRPEAAQNQELAPLPEELNQHVQIVGETTDMEWARNQLREGEVDAVAVIPADPAGIVRGGERIPLQILTSEIDPVRKSYARAYLADQVATLNSRTIARAIRDAQASIEEMRTQISTAREYVGLAMEASGGIEQTREQVAQIRTTIGPLSDTAARVSRALDGVSIVLPGLGRQNLDGDSLADSVERVQRLVNDLDTRLNQADGTSALPTEQELLAIDKELGDLEATITEVNSIPPETLAAPFRLQLENVAPFIPTFAGFYAPAVLVLLLQHLAVTLGALSMARVRLIGLMDVLRTAPVRASEVVMGNYLSYGTLSVVAAAVLTGLVVVLLSVPVFGSWVLVGVGLLLLIATALGVGFVISLISSSEQQAAQLSMLLLLCAIFFSGFVFSLDRVAWPVRAISYALPSTYAIRTLQDVMLRGVLRHPEDLAILGGTAVVLFMLTLHLFRREFRPA